MHTNTLSVIVRVFVHGPIQFLEHPEVNRFPPDFMFRLTNDESENLRSQNATSSLKEHGGRRYLPYVFTEYGAIMVANIINSQHAVEMSILVVRVFI